MTDSTMWWVVELWRVPKASLSWEQCEACGGVRLHIPNHIYERS